ncbi:MAG: HAMP domain-containing sensor histidine kinase [Trueperaceae bacterium]
MLRFRLSLLVTTALLVAILAFGLLAVALFGRLQYRQLETLLERDLERVGRLVESSQVGARLVDGASGGRLQFVSGDGELQLPPDAGEILPYFSEPELVQYNGVPLLTASVPWRLPSGNEIGTIRIGYEATEIGRARLILIRSLLVSGVAISLLVLQVSLRTLRRALSPLKTLAEQADQLDPANPVMKPYQGPDDEVARVATALERALDAIRARQRSERDALAEVAHELAAPLSVVAGQLNALAAESDDPRFRAARDAADELLYTSQDLLTLARGELELPLELVAVDLHEVACRVARQYPGVRVVGESGAEVLGSLERLTQVVRNLVRNAVQAGEAGTVTISVEQVGDRVELAVHDEGRGLDVLEQARIFERFVTGSPSQGTGVGLTVAKGIVERHEGELAVSSRPGKGSVFTVRLPTLAAQIEEESGSLEL